LETSRGGIGAVFMFRDNGVLDFSPGAVVEGKYRVEGNRLISPEENQNGPEIIDSLSENELWLTFENTITEMTREGDIADPKNLISGTWRIKSDKTSGTWQFRVNGTALMSSPAGATEVKYRLEGNRLILPERPETAMVIVALKENQLRLRHVVRMTREGQVIDAGNLIWGTWRTVTNKSSLLRQFRPDGTDLLIVPFRTDHGRYTVSGDQIRIEIDGQQPVAAKIRWENNILILPGPTGNGESRFARY
jgi:hypothetical protein